MWSRRREGGPEPRSPGDPEASESFLGLRPDGPGRALVCPVCADPYSNDERFCRRCGIPLVFAGDTELTEPVSATHAHARKIKPQLADGPLVRVAGARNQAEAEFIQALLLEEGVPSLLRRSRGFDVPDFLAAGPRDLLVPASGASTAAEVLLDADLAPTGDPPPLPPVRLAVGLLIAAGLVALLAWLITQVG